MQMINVGYGNMVAAERIIAIVAPDAAPIRRRENSDESLFIRSVEGVFEVDDVRFQVDGRELRYSCQLLTEEGTAALEYTFD